jgi:hypothetical protein
MSGDVHLFSELQISLNLGRKTDVYPTPIEDLNASLQKPFPRDPAVE